MHYNFVVFEILVSLAIGAFIWLILFGRSRRDDFRCSIRALRDHLFDVMWENGFDYKTPAYVQTRQVLNGLIRISNILGPIGFIAQMVLVQLWEKEPQADHIDDPSLPEKLRAELVRTRNEAMSKMMKFIYLTGLTGIIVRGLLSLLSIGHWAFKAKEAALGNAKRMLRVAYLAGAPDTLSDSSKTLAIVRGA